MCCNVDDWIGEPEYMAGFWIINTELAEVVDRLTIDYGGRIVGVRHACVSSIDPCVVYVNPDLAYVPDLLAIDHDSGDVLWTIPLVEDFKPEFIYEIPDGRLIVTGGTSGKILIIDPSE